MTPVSDTPLLEIRRLYVSFPQKDQNLPHIPAVHNVSLHLKQGETLGIAGESGSGKTTLLRSILRLHKISSGNIFFNGEEISRMPQKAFLPLRKNIQMIFQDPYASLDPRMTVFQIISEPLLIFKKHKLLSLSPQQIRLKVFSVIDKVGLHPSCLPLCPHEFSGGERQRISIARTLILKPELILADEPVSALDASVQARILNLLNSLRQNSHTSCIFVSHDLAAVRRISQRIAVMLAGRIVETAESEALFQAPLHPYTQALLAAVSPPKIYPPHQKISENFQPGIPMLSAGCPYAAHCPIAKEICLHQEPPLKESAPRRLAACFMIK